MRVELQELLRELELPTLIVTHDYEDAAALADTVGVIVEGELRQLGSPRELVSQPRDPFVASLTGANLLRGTASQGNDGLTSVRLEGGELVYSTDPGDGAVGVVVYPWDVSVGRAHADDSAMNVLSGEVGSVVHLGNRVRVRVGPLTAEVTAASADRLELGRERAGVRLVQGDRNEAGTACIKRFTEPVTLSSTVSDDFPPRSCDLRVQPSVTASTYSRPVLGAPGKLRASRPDSKRLAGGSSQRPQSFGISTDPVRCSTCRRRARRLRRATQPEKARRRRK